MGQAVTQSTRSTTGRALAALMERISNQGGLTRTQRPLRHERWVLARDIRHSMDIGAAGIGGRLLGLVSFYMVLVLPCEIANPLTEGPLLLKNLREAVDMTRRSEDICEDFEKHRPPAMVREWKMIKQKWEKDVSQPDPYQVVEKGKAVVPSPPLNPLVTNSVFSQPLV